MLSKKAKRSVVKKAVKDGKGGIENPFPSNPENPSLSGGTAQIGGAPSISKQPAQNSNNLAQKIQKTVVGRFANRKIDPRSRPAPRPVAPPAMPKPKPNPIDFPRPQPNPIQPQPVQPQPIQPQPVKPQPLPVSPQPTPMPSPPSYVPPIAPGPPPKGSYDPLDPPAKRILPPNQWGREFVPYVPVSDKDAGFIRELGRLPSLTIDSYNKAREAQHMWAHTRPPTMDVKPEDDILYWLKTYPFIGGQDYKRYPAAPGMQYLDTPR